MAISETKQRFDLTSISFSGGEYRLRGPKLDKGTRRFEIIPNGVASPKVDIIPGDIDAFQVLVPAGLIYIGDHWYQAERRVIIMASTGFSPREQMGPPVRGPVKIPKWE